MPRRVSTAYAALVAAALSVSGCAPGAAPAGGWTAAVGRDLPLVGRIWDARAERFVSEEEVWDALARARFVLLGEKHDNPDHHRLQARALAALVARGRAPVVVFEMLDETQAQPLATLQAGGGAVSAESLRETVDWDAHGWPPFRLYAPVFDVALGAGLRIVAGDLAAETVRVISRRGVAALSAEQVVALGLAEPLAPAVEEAMREEIRAAHCGHAAEPTIGAMVLAQRARDGALAAALTSALASPGSESGGTGAVLVAGAGHVRRDRAVPARLDAVGAAGGVAVLRFVEAPDGYAATVPNPAQSARAPLAAQARRAARPDPAQEPLVDFDWYTPRVDASDPCERFREQLESLRAGSGGSRGSEDP